MSDRRKKKSAWICSVPLTQRHYRKISDISYAFVEIRETAEGFSVSHDVVSLSGMTFDEIESLIGASIDEIIAACGIRDGIRAVCECVFERLGAEDMEFNLPAGTRDEAAEKLRDFIRGKGPLAKYYDYDEFGNDRT